ncbi:MAG: M24 family metallopeptidase [Acidimicrobiales bacterium]
MTTSRPEIERRYQVMREAMEAAGVAVLVVAGSEYTGFEGAIRYISGFRIVHRYAYAVLPLEGEPFTLFPSEARYVGDHADGWVTEQHFADVPGAFLGEYARRSGAKRVGVYGLDYVMAVRDYRALAATDGIEVVSFDEQFDLARSARSEEELDEIRASMAINEEGFWAVHAAYEPGRTEAELMARAEEVFARRGTGRLTMDMVLSGRDGAAEPEFRIPDPYRPIEATDMLLYSLEIAGPGGYWTEFTRPLCQGPLPETTKLMLEAYDEYFEHARRTLRVGASAHDVHRAVSQPYLDRSLGLGHVTGHSIGTTMIEFPRIGEGAEVELRANMVISMHPHALSPDGRSCMYMQDTWLVTPEGGQLLSLVPAKVFDGSESRQA